MDTGSALKAHFWNFDPACDPAKHVDLTWQQFAEGSKVVRFKILDRHVLDDSPPTIARCQLLLERVLMKLKSPVQLERPLAGTTKEDFGSCRGGKLSVGLFQQYRRIADIRLRLPQWWRPDISQDRAARP